MNRYQDIAGHRCECVLTGCCAGVRVTVESGRHLKKGVTISVPYDDDDTWRAVAEAALLSLVKRGDLNKGELTRREKENARDTAKMLDRAFTWHKTKEGQNYWSEVVGKLIVIADSKD